MNHVLAIGVGAFFFGCTSVDVLGTRARLEEDGRTASEAKALLDEAFQQLFFGDPETEAVFRDQGDGTGYVEDIAHRDVRTDSMGYGMLITVQLDQREVFDELWTWTKEHMMSRSGPTAGLLRWQCDTSGTTCATYAATDASSVIATSLLMAEQRWGGGGPSDYGQEGRQLLEAMSGVEARNGGVVEGVVNCFDLDAALPRTDSTTAAKETPTDYLMPAFYEIWATRDEERADLWTRMAMNARSLLEQVPHPTTGLLPEMVDYDGAPIPDRDAYRHTTSRALFNLAVDHRWYGPHEWVVEQDERLLDFFSSEGVESYVSEYTTSGERLVGFNTIAHKALVALAAHTSGSPEYAVFLEDLLDEPIPTGEYRYYDGMLYLLSLLVISGQITPG